MNDGSRSLTVLFLPESAYGPTNQRIGLGDVLARRGHQVVFAAESSWRGRREPLGFEEQLVDLAEPAEASRTPERSGPSSSARPRRSFAGTPSSSSTLHATHLAGPDRRRRRLRPRLGEILADVRPDVVVEDNVVAFPALLTGEAPYVRIVSCNPLEVDSPELPPAYSGLPSADPTGWASFRAEYDRTHRETWSAFNEWVVSRTRWPSGRPAAAWCTCRWARSAALTSS